MAKGTKTLNKGLKVAEAWNGSDAYEHEVFIKLRSSAPTDGDIDSNEIVLSLDGTEDTHPPTCRQAAETWGNAPFEGKVSVADLARAAALYEESIAVQPGDMHAYVDAARIHEALGDYGRAASLWRRGARRLAVRRPREWGCRVAGVALGRTRDEPSRGLVSVGCRASGCLGVGLPVVVRVR